MAKRPKSNKTEHRMATALDRLAAFEAFEDEILPALREMLNAGASAEQIYEKFAPLAAARAVTVLVKEADSTKALSAAKEVLDRTRGKATERKEVKHELAALPDDQLDALLAAKLEASDDDEAEIH